MNSYELLQQQVSVNSALLKGMDDLQNLIIQAQRSKDTTEHLDHLSKMWQRICLALVEREEIVGVEEDPDKDMTTERRDDDLAVDIMSPSIQKRA